MKLLQLRRPPLPRRIAPHHPQGLQVLQTTNPATVESHQYKLKNYQAVSVPKRQLSFNPTPMNSQPKSQMSDRSKGAKLHPTSSCSYTCTNGGPSSAALRACSAKQHHVPQTTHSTFLQALFCHCSSGGRSTYDQASAYRTWSTNGKQHFCYFKTVK